MNLQLYMVDSMNYLVDFTTKSYCVLTEPGTGRFNMHISDLYFSEISSETCSIMDKNKKVHVKEGEVVSLFVFMEILVLAGLRKWYGKERME